MPKDNFSQPHHLRLAKWMDKEARLIAAQAELDILTVLRLAIKAGLPSVKQRFGVGGK